MGRSAQGVRIVNIERPDFVIGVDRIAREKDEEHLDDSDENQTAETEEVDPAMETEPDSQDSDRNEDTEV
jgi:DNA gyrase subunit A